MVRDPYDGKPFYCVTCGAGFDEYGVCELVDCALESVQIAQLRQQRKRNVGSETAELKAKFHD